MVFWVALHAGCKAALTCPLGHKGNAAAQAVGLKSLCVPQNARFLNLFACASVGWGWALVPVPVSYG